MKSIGTKPLPSARGWKAEYSLATVCVLLAIIYAYGQSNLTFIGAFSNVITPFEAFAAFAMAALAWKMNSGKRGGGMSRVYASFSIGIGLWVVAEGIWSFYVLVLGIVIPFPSLADLFWLVGYVPLLCGLLLQAWPFRDAFSRLKRAALVTAMLVMTGAILIVAIPPLFSQELDSLSFLVSVLYPFLDSLLLSVAVPLLLLFRKGAYWRPMLFVLVGLILQFVGDLAFAQGVLIGSYYSGSPTDLIFDFSYLTLTLGFYEASRPVLLRVEL